MDDDERNADLSEIISGLEQSDVEDLDLTQFLNESTTRTSGYFARDLLTLDAPTDPFMFVAEPTPDIIRPLVEATTVIPASDIVWNTAPSSYSSNQPNTTTQTFAQYWGNKRTFDDSSNVTNFELPPMRSQYDSKPEIDSFGYRDYETGYSSKEGKEKDDKTAKRRKLTPEEKMEKRKQQTRTASKLYRQRRKELEGQLSERLEALEKEKKALQNEKKAAEDLLNKLKDENAKLRANQKVFSQENAKKRYELLIRLQKEVSEGADDDQLCNTIQEIKKCCGTCSEIGTCNLMSIVNPSSIQQLIKNGFFEHVNLDLEKKGNIDDVINKMKAELGSSLSKGQVEKIENEAALHSSNLAVIIGERATITDSINKAFKEYQQRNDERTSKEVIKCLEHLRNSLGSEAKLFNDTFTTILDGTLTPLQMAHFFLKVEFQHRSVTQLNTFWSALNRTLNLNPNSVKIEGLQGGGPKGPLFCAF